MRSSDGQGPGPGPKCEGPLLGAQWAVGLTFQQAPTAPLLG